MKRIIFLLGVIGLLYSCEKEDDATNGIPNCIDEKINEIKNGDVWNPPAKIYSYTYDGQTVYYFPPRCCDIPSSLYDKNCNLICSPDGGITGGGDGSCADFFSERTDEKLIWEDTRE